MLKKATCNQVINRLVGWNTALGRPSDTAFEYSTKISFTTAGETWIEGTFDEAGLGLAMFQGLPLGLNLVQLQVNGVQVSFLPIKRKSDGDFMVADMQKVFV